MKTNLTCADCERELSAYLDGALTAAVARVLETHVAACPRCDARLTDYREIARRLAELPEIAAPLWLERSVVRGATVKERARRLWHRGIAAAAALSFAATAGIIAVLPKLARQWGLPDPGTWPFAVLSAALEGIASLSKRLALDATFYAPFAKQVWLALQALESVPRAALLSLRTTEAQAVGVLLLTLGGAIYFALRPSRTHEGGIGHACLSL